MNNIPAYIGSKLGASPEVEERDDLSTSYMPTDQGSESDKIVGFNQTDLAQEQVKMIPMNTNGDGVKRKSSAVRSRKKTSVGNKLPVNPNVSDHQELLVATEDKLVINSERQEEQVEPQKEGMLEGLKALSGRKKKTKTGLKAPRSRSSKASEASNEPALDPTEDHDLLSTDDAQAKESESIVAKEEVVTKPKPALKKPQTRKKKTPKSVSSKSTRKRNDTELLSEEKVAINEGAKEEESAGLDSQLEVVEEIVNTTITTVSEIVEDKALTEQLKVEISEERVGEEQQRRKEYVEKIRNETQNFLQQLATERRQKEKEYAELRKEIRKDL